MSKLLTVGSNSRKQLESHKTTSPKPIDTESRNRGNDSNVEYPLSDSDMYAMLEYAADGISSLYERWRQ